jgi:transcriptional regulator with XRE-family HTH domain
MSRLKQLIRKQKAALGLSSEDLALATGITCDELRSIENSDDIGDTPVTVVHALAGALDVPAWQLIELIEKTPPVPPTYLAQQIDAAYARFDQ